jgi:hypothetical protein
MQDEFETKLGRLFAEQRDNDVDEASSQQFMQKVVERLQYQQRVRQIKRASGLALFVILMVTITPWITKGTAMLMTLAQQSADLPYRDWVFTVLGGIVLGFGYLMRRLMGR